MNDIVFESLTNRDRKLATSSSARRTLRDRIAGLVESRRFSVAIMALIVINAITLGLETSPAVMNFAGPFLMLVDRIALLAFTVEILLKLYVYRASFFRGGWNLFDLAVVAIAWVPSAGALTVLRALRVLRVLRLVSVVPQLRSVIGALFNALPGMGSIVAVLMLVFYVASVMTTKLFGEAFPEWFGSIGASMYSLFQVMTLESWSMGIVRPVMEQYPYAWVFFVPFVVITSFAVLNLFIALIVNSMQTINADDRVEAAAAQQLAHDEREVLLNEIRALREEVRGIRKSAAPSD